MSLENLWVLLPAVVMTALLGLYVWLIFAAYDDMQKRDQPGWLYAVAIVFMPFIGSIAWMYGRSRYPIKGPARRTTTGT